MYTGFNELKLYGKEDDALNEFVKVNEELRETGFKAQFISGIMSPLISLVIVIFFEHPECNCSRVHGRESSIGGGGRGARE